MEETKLPSYVTSALRYAGGVAAGYLIGKGYITAEQAPVLGGAALAVITAAWTLYSKYHARQALKAAIAAPAGLAS